MPLLAATDCTTRLRVCPLVLNNDFHHPVHLAR
jgi:alkanesulfonate monooxygenase SsuD/methylene tetrahydromethanopterin reductase-like flavin-dependent oxidoreductase (luciferase family)